MSKRFTNDLGTFHIDEVMRGQSALMYYDTLAQIALNPSLREGVILSYETTGVEGLFSQLQALVKADKRVVATNPYYWAEATHDVNITVGIKRADAAGVANQSITVKVEGASHSRNGQFSNAMKNRRAYIKELPGVVANITDVNRTVTGGHTVTLEGVNGKALDLTKHATYTLLVDPMRMYKKGTMDKISTEGLVKQPPLLRKGYLQKFEKGYSIHEEELNGYAYDVEFKLYKGFDADGKPVVNWGIEHLNKQILEDFMDSKNINTMIGQRDDKNENGFDGIFTTAEAEGMFSRRYDPNDGVSFKTILLNMMKSQRKVNGATEWILAYDYGFRIDFSEAMALMVMGSKGNLTYKLFGEGGEGARSFKHYEFTDFEAFGYKYRGFQVDAFDAQRYGNWFENVAFVMPATTYKDHLGKTVSPVTYVNIGASELSAEQKIKVDDTRARGLRTLDVYAEDTYGMEIHCATKLGIFRRTEV